MNTTGSFIGDALTIMALLTAFAVSLWVSEMLAVYGERVYEWFLARINRR